MKHLRSVFFGTLVLVIAAVPTLAAPPSPPKPPPPLRTLAVAPEMPEIPEVPGDYPDPLHPGVRVRVFVHGPKVQAASALACDDPDSTATDSAAGWKLPAGTWIYNLNPNSAPSSIGPTNVVTIAQNSFQPYGDALSSATEPSPVRGADTTVAKTAYDGKNIIAWGRTSALALGVTYIRYYPATGLAVDVDTILNKRFAWSWNGGSAIVCGDPNSYDAQNILTHEIGHWFGLDDEYDVLFSHNTMFGYGAKGEVKKDTLATGDKAALLTLYP